MRRDLVFSSFIKLLVAMDTDCKVLGIDILGHGETPGLGDQIGQDWFKRTRIRK